jgi:hypothetical protein
VYFASGSDYVEGTLVKVDEPGEFSFDDAIDEAWETWGDGVQFVGLLVFDPPDFCYIFNLVDGVRRASAVVFVLTVWSILGGG